MPRKPAYPKRITARLLKRRGACAVAVADFQDSFPQGMEVTRANLIKAIVEADLQYDWALGKFLSNQPYLALCSQIEQIESEASNICWAAVEARSQATKEAQKAIPDHLRDQPDSLEKEGAIVRYRSEKNADILAEYNRRHKEIYHDEAMNLAGAIADFLQLP